MNCAVSVRIPDAGSIPILEFPGLDLPRRERLQPPRLEPLGAVTKARGVLGRDGGKIDDARQIAPDLARRLADYIDKFWLIGHRRLLAKRSFPQGASLPATP